MELKPIIESLQNKRQVFHSEADLQFALAWEIQLQNPKLDVRLEYPIILESKTYVDILVVENEFAIPIELKYKTKKFEISLDGEQYDLKNHGAQDLGCYDCIKDICRIEQFIHHLDFCEEGYAVWLTNDPYYWQAPLSETVGYYDFSIHQNACISGEMQWQNHLSPGTIKGREKPLRLNGEYLVNWEKYSNLNGGVTFKYNLARAGIEEN